MKSREGGGELLGQVRLRDGRNFLVNVKSLRKSFCYGVM